MAWLGVFILCVIFVRWSVCCPNGCRCETWSSCNGTYVGCSLIGLTTVPTNIPKGTCELVLSGNALTTVRKGSFEGLTNLRRITLSVNAIRTVRKGSFEGLTSLREIDLQTNAITTIEKGSFEGLANLRKIWFNSNKITMIEKGSFEGLTNLQTLDLRYNLLRSVNKDLVDGLSRLTDFYLVGNPLECDCELVAFLTVARTKSLSLGESSCYTPRTPNGTLLKDLPLQEMTMNCALTTTTAAAAAHTDDAVSTTVAPTAVHTDAVSTTVAPIAVHTDAVSTTVTLTSTCDSSKDTSDSTKDTSDEQGPMRDFTEATIPGGGIHFKYLFKT